jgi:hypothetical protein
MGRWIQLISEKKQSTSSPAAIRIFVVIRSTVQIGVEFAKKAIYASNSPATRQRTHFVREGKEPAPGPVERRREAKERN